jgi:hypothetical protein
MIKVKECMCAKYFFVFQWWRQKRSSGTTGVYSSSEVGIMGPFQTAIPRDSPHFYHTHTQKKFTYVAKH